MEDKSIHIDNYLPNAFGEKYHAKNDTYLSCINCGRDTSKQGNSNGVYIVGGGEWIAHPDQPEFNDGGDMGWFPVGSECIKKVPAEYRTPNPYDDKVHGV